MASTLTVKVTKKKCNNEVLWEGTASVAGARPTKLTKSKSQDTTFSTAGAVKKAAEKFATTHGYEGVKFDEAAAAKTTTVSKTSKTASKTPTKSSKMVKAQSICTFTPATV
jgi:hypothetical protein